MIIKAYCYWFYKFYSLLESYEQTRWFVKTKALIIVGVIEILFIASIHTYFKILTFKHSDKFNLGAILITALACIFITFKWQAFKDDRWKEYVKEFEAKDRESYQGTYIVVIIAIIILANLIFSMSCWRQMQGWPV